MEKKTKKNVKTSSEKNLKTGTGSKKKQIIKPKTSPKAKNSVKNIKTVNKKKVDNIYPHKNLHVVYTFYSSFIHTCPNLETIYILQEANG